MLIATPSSPKAANGVEPLGGAGLSDNAPMDFSSIGVVNASFGWPLVKRASVCLVTVTPSKRSTSNVRNVPFAAYSLGRLPSRGITPGSITTSYCVALSRSCAGTSA